jgi:hypothetical protein
MIRKSYPFSAEDGQDLSSRLRRVVPGGHFNYATNLKQCSNVRLKKRPWDRSSRSPGPVSAPRLHSPEANRRIGSPNLLCDIITVLPLPSRDAGLAPSSCPSLSLSLRLLSLNVACKGFGRKGRLPRVRKVLA